MSISGACWNFLSTMLSICAKMFSLADLMTSNFAYICIRCRMAGLRTVFYRHLIHLAEGSVVGKHLGSQTEGHGFKTGGWQTAG